MVPSRFASSIPVSPSSQALSGASQGDPISPKCNVVSTSSHLASAMTSPSIVHPSLAAPSLSEASLGSALDDSQHPIAASGSASSALGSNPDLPPLHTRRGSARPGREDRSQGSKRRPPQGGRSQGDASLLRFPTARLFVPDKVAMDSNREAYLGLNRVGGILREAFTNKPAPSEPRFTDMASIVDVLQETGVDDHNMHSDTPQKHLRNGSPYLVDLAVMLYTVGLQITYQRLSAQVRAVQDLHARLTKITAAIEQASADSARASSITRLKDNRAKILEDLATETRALEWQQSVAVHGGWKSAAISQLSMYLAALLRKIQEQAPNIWAHVPEMYVECAVCSFHALQRSRPRALMPTAMHVAALLSHLLGDSRLVSPNMHDVVLQSVTNLLSSPGTLAAISSDDEIMDRLIPGLMERYTQEHWTTLSATFLRAIGRDLPPWEEGTVAAAVGPPSSASRPPPVAIAAVRARIARFARDRHPAAMRFVQNLFSALDWAVTEATVCLRAGAAAVVAGRPSSFSTSQRRRLLVFFSIAVTCAQLMAFLVTDVPSLFLRGPPVLADRLAEMLAFLIVHAPVDSTTDEYSVLTTSAGSVDRTNNPFLQPLALARPLVTMLGSLWELENSAPCPSTPPPPADTASEEPGKTPAHTAAEQDQPGPSSSAPKQPQPAPAKELSFVVQQSVVERLCAMPAACPNEHLDQLRNAVLAAGDAPHSSEESSDKLREHCHAVGEMVEAFVRRRAAGGTPEADIPEEYMDPITMACMVDPVRLPDSGVVLDRSTIERHLEESNLDPYSRAPLEASALEPMPELQKAIEAWQASHAASMANKRGSLPGIDGELTDRSTASGQGGGSALTKANGSTIVSHVPESWELDSDHDSDRV